MALTSTGAAAAVTAGAAHGAGGMGALEMAEPVIGGWASVLTAAARGAARGAGGATGATGASGCSVETELPRLDEPVLGDGDEAEPASCTAFFEVYL
jgi:hypothetical protein